MASKEESQDSGLSKEAILPRTSFCQRQLPSILLEPHSRGDVLRERLQSRTAFRKMQKRADWGYSPPYAAPRTTTVFKGAGAGAGETVVGAILDVDHSIWGFLSD